MKLFVKNSKYSGFKSLAWLFLLLASILFGNEANAASLTMPSSLETDTSNFVLLSSSGTTPVVSGFVSNLKIIVSVTNGTLKLTTTAGLTAPTGFTTAQWTSGTASEISFEGSQTDVNNALATLAYKGGGKSSTTLNASATPTGASYDPDNGHYYKWVSTTSTWEDAKTAAAGTTFNGLTGYLVTITSAAEETFITTKITSSLADFWAGASDATTEGDWKWVTGPEGEANGGTGTSFWSGNASGNAVNGAYTNWNAGEPNNGGTGEDYMERTSTGTWNDVPNNGYGFLKGHVIEYGGLAGETATIQASTTLTIVSTQNVSSPLVDADVVAGIEAQINISRLFMKNSTYAVLDRMEWLRRHKEKANKTNLTAQVQFSSSSVTQIADLLPVSEKLNALTDKALPDSYAIWTEGSITTGKTGATGTASKQTLRSNGFTIGLDKEIGNNTFLGAAVRKGRDDVNVGNAHSGIASAAYSFSIYGSRSYNDAMFIDGLFGVSKLAYDITRDNGFGIQTGKRNGRQIFGSLNLHSEIDVNSIHITPYGRADLGYTRLSSYNESGTVMALNYETQNLRSTVLSTGFLMDYTIRNNDGFFLKPHSRVEYGRDVSPSSDAVMSYVATPDTKYTLGVDPQASSNWRLGLGADFGSNDGLNITLDAERNQAVGSGHTETFHFKASYPVTSKAKVTLDFNNNFTSQMQAGIGTIVNFANGLSLTADYSVQRGPDTKLTNAFTLRTVASW